MRSPRPRPVEPPTTPPWEPEPADECSRELRRRGFSWIVAATLGLVAAAALVLLVALVVGSALPSGTTSPSQTAIAPPSSRAQPPAPTPALKVVTTAAVTSGQARAVVFEPERVTRSVRQRRPGHVVRRARRAPAVNADALLAASRRAGVDPDRLLAAGVRQARRSPRRDRHGVVLPSWTR